MLRATIVINQSVRLMAPSMESVSGGRGTNGLKGSTALLSRTRGAAGGRASVEAGQSVASFILPEYAAPLRAQDAD